MIFPKNSQTLQDDLARKKLEKDEFLMACREFKMFTGRWPTREITIELLKLKTAKKD